ncbi:casparian strip membrane protein 1 [Triticum dicoccoides]|uniref:casparian strip membrane protein 1 n=1 Tax=Triticum dicoccoides TaxID=85692 RepID=UPI0018901E59|nr:casparian strip membrane protein 1 [Triticum dicoccoides]
MSTSEAATVIPVYDVAPGQGAPSKAPAAAPPSAAAAAPAAAATTTAPRKFPMRFFRRSDRGSRCMAFLDFLLRIAAFGPALAAAIATGTSDETLSVFTEFFQFRARFDDFPAFLFLMVASAIAAGYLLLSLPFSAVVVLRPQTTVLRLLLLVCDTIMLGLLTAGAAAAAAIVDLAHSGNERANWVPICMQFHGFCRRTSGAVVASFLSVFIFVLLVVLAAFSIRKR